MQAIKLKENMKAKLPGRIQKRDGRIVKFMPSKITRAMFKAFMATGELARRRGGVDGGKKSLGEAKRLTPIAVDLFSQTINHETPSVEAMQDVVEKVLMAAGHYQTAKAYILYRAEHKKLRKARLAIGVEDDLDLEINQLKVLERQYLRHDREGKVIETPKQLFLRVAKAISLNEKKKQKYWQEKFFEIMTRFEFIPAGGYLRSAGIKDGLLANCFVLPVEDSMEGIFNAVKWMALVQQKGGGTGFNFSHLRPQGDFVTTSGGFSSGPVSFMKIFDEATRQVMQGGYKKGANMGVLDVDHPDIFDFITCKSEEDQINNFNISVGITDEFMRSVEKDKEFALKNPRTGKAVQLVPARTLFNQIVTSAWRRGDPGLIFLDTINKNNPVLETLGPMRATNVCGEQPLHPFDVCNLGSINLTKFVSPPLKTIDLKRLGEVVRLAVRFLDNGVDISSYPIPQITHMAQANRRVGLGIMGWADLLYGLRIPYHSQEGRDLAEKIMKHITSLAHDESEKLAKEKGVFPNWRGSSYQKERKKRRNIALTTIAPTGTISMVANCSSGIEPNFALSFVKNVVDEEGLTYINSYFRKALEETVKDEEKHQEILDWALKTGSCQKVIGLTNSLKKVFVTAHDISWEAHIKMQAAFQKHTDNAVSKTINFPHSATIDDVAQAYLLAWKLGCKGITIYRDGSRSEQILKSRGEEGGIITNEPIIQSKVMIDPLKKRLKKRLMAMSAASQETSSCPECGGKMQMSEGCSTCLECGYSRCSL